MPSVEAAALADTGRMLAGLCEHCDRLAILLELLLEVTPVNIHKPLPHSRLGLEARVGIGRISSPLHL
jgi:thiol-disulfide isomerase/thioredoxin